MALAKHTITAPSSYQLPVLVEDRVQTTIVSSDGETVRAASAYISGSPWKLRSYYNQILAPDNTPKDFDRNASPVSQRYREIQDMLFRVTSPLSNTTDTATGLTQMTGEANVYAILVPYIGDVFFALVAGSQVQFKITNVTRLTYSREAGHSVTYAAANNSDVAVLQELIKARSDEHLVFSQDRLASALTPLLRPAQVKTLLDLRVLREDFVDMYFSLFFDRQVNTFVLPYEERVADPFLVRFMTGLLETTDHPDALNAKNIFSFLEIADRTMDVLKEIAEGNYRAIGRCARASKMRANVPPSNAIKGTTSFRNGIRYRVMMEDEANFSEYASLPMVLTVEPPYKQMNTVVRSPPYLKAVVAGEPLFTEAFYTGGAGTAIETLLSDLLTDRPLDVSLLLSVAGSVYGETLLTQAYYIPVLIFLMKQTAHTEVGG